MAIGHGDAYAMYSFSGNDVQAADCSGIEELWVAKLNECQKQGLYSMQLGIMGDSSPTLSLTRFHVPTVTGPGSDGTGSIM